MTRQGLAARRSTVALGEQRFEQRDGFDVRLGGLAQEAFVVVAHREVERRAAVAVPGLKVGAVRGEEPDNRIETLHRGAVQRGAVRYRLRARYLPATRPVAVVAAARNLPNAAAAGSVTMRASMSAPASSSS